MGSYAGWLGTVAARYDQAGKMSGVPTIEESSHRLAAVAGTSTCHLVQVRVLTLSRFSAEPIVWVFKSPKGVFVDGVWGPYKVFYG